MHRGTNKGLISGLTHGNYRGNVKGLAKGLSQNDRKRRNRPIYMIINAGQSNCEKGAIFATSDLVSPYKGPFPEVQYFGTGNAFRTLYYADDDSYQNPVTGTFEYANQFYLYPAVAASLGCNASNPLYVCSYSVGDTDLATDWSSTGPGTLYTTFVSLIKSSKALIRARYGVNPTILFCLFDQGEKDGRDSTKATNYGTNITNFVTNLRTAISEPGLKFIFPLIKMGAVVGSPNPVDFGGTINQHKITLAATDPTRILTTDSNFSEPSTDGVHFTVAGQLAKNIGVGGTVGAQRMSQRQVMIDNGWLLGVRSSAVPTSQTYFNGVYNFVRFGDILDSIIAAASGSFRIGLTVWNPPAYGSRTLVSKFASTSTANQRCFHWLLAGSTTINFNYYINVGTGAQVRGITWTQPTDLRDGNEHTLEIRYTGSVNTNDGLDRVDLYYDGSLYTTGKTLATSVGTLTNTLFNSTAQLAVGAIVANGGLKDSLNFIAGGWMREFFFQNGSGTDQIRVPSLATGTDTSGNGNNGTYV